MGRREKPVSSGSVALLELAEWLREQRHSAGLSYRQLAERTSYHATTLQRAASGTSVPKLAVATAYARACGAPTDTARQLWKHARCEERKTTRGGRAPAPPPDLVHDLADLSAALCELYERAGAPPLRLMEKRAGGYGNLPRSSAHRIVNKQSIPYTRPQFRAFLEACEVPEDEWPVWEAAWRRAWKNEERELLPMPNPLPRLSLDTRFWLYHIPGALPVLRALDTRRGMTTAEAAQLAGTSLSTAGLRLRELRGRHLVATARRGRTKIYILTRLGLQARRFLLELHIKSLLHHVLSGESAAAQPLLVQQTLPSMGEDAAGDRWHYPDPPRYRYSVPKEYLRRWENFDSHLRQYVIAHRGVPQAGRFERYLLQRKPQLPDSPSNPLLEYYMAELAERWHTRSNAA